MTEYDPIQKAQHYEDHPSGIACAQLMDYLNCNVANALKYVWRCDKKGAPLSDLKKARWYLARHVRNTWAPLFVYESCAVPMFAESVERYMARSWNQFTSLAVKVQFCEQKDSLLCRFLDQLGQGDVQRALEIVVAEVEHREGAVTP